MQGDDNSLLKMLYLANDGYHEKVDRPPAGLEYDSYSDGSLFGGEDPRITENCLHIKAKIRKTPVFVVEVTPKS